MVFNPSIPSVNNLPTAGSPVSTNKSYNPSRELMNPSRISGWIDPEVHCKGRPNSTTPAPAFLDIEFEDSTCSPAAVREVEAAPSGDSPYQRADHQALVVGRDPWSLQKSLALKAIEIVRPDNRAIGAHYSIGLEPVHLLQENRPAGLVVMT